MRGERDVGKLRRLCVRRLLEGWSVRDVSAHAQVWPLTIVLLIAGLRLFFLFTILIVFIFRFNSDSDS